jgi:hypothetical protein
VVWDKGSIIKLDVPIPEPTNINERGEIAGVGLTPSCEDSNLCGHEFLLVPCENNAAQDCNLIGNIVAQPRSATKPTSATAKHEGRYTAKDFVLALRARMMRRYRNLGLPLASH